MNNNSMNDFINSDLFKNANKIIENVNKGIPLRCNKKCQQNKKSRELYNEFLEAKNNFSNAPTKLEDAEQNYYTFENGGVWYANFREEKAKKEVKLISKNMIDIFEEKRKDLKILLDSYNSQKIYKNHIQDLVDDYNNKINKVNKNIDNLRNKDNINHRLTIYDESSIDNYIYYQNIIKKMYWVLVVFFAFYIMGYKQRYKEKQVWIILLLVIIYPFIISLIIKILKLTTITKVKLTPN